MSTCTCQPAERILEYPITTNNPRIKNLVNSYLEDKFSSASQKAKEYSLLGFSLATGFSLFSGPAMMAATAVAMTPIALLGYGLVYLCERPRQWDYDFAVFLINEKLTNDPTATDEQILTYLRNERFKFYSSTCSSCEDINS
jgi:hypothetical protein